MLQAFLAALLPVLGLFSDTEEFPMPSAVQKLYEVCNETFSSSAVPVPPQRAIQRLRSVLDTIKPVDVGLNEDVFENDHGYGLFGPSLWRGRHSRIVARWAAPVTYLHLYECDRFSIGIFCLPASAVIPFHNHPGMTVLSKLLFGSMYIKAYDWVDPINTETNSNPSQLRLARLEVDNVFTSPCDTSVLYPTSGGNIHSFRAVTSCAVLDVLGPPYSDIEGRNCTYYSEYPYSSLPDDGNTIPDDDDQGCAWLEEIKRPDEFIVRGAPYKGPQIEA